MEWLGSEGVAAAVAVFAPWVRLWPVGKPRFLLLTFIPGDSFGSVHAFPISARCYVMIVLLGIFHISPLLFLLQHEAQCLILLTAVQTGITGEMLIPFLLEYFPIIYSGFLRERRL